MAAAGSGRPLPSVATLAVSTSEFAGSAFPAGTAGSAFTARTAGSAFSTCCCCFPSPSSCCCCSCWLWSRAPFLPLPAAGLGL